MDSRRKLDADAMPLVKLLKCGDKPFEQFVERRGQINQIGLKSRDMENGFRHHNMKKI